MEAPHWKQTWGAVVKRMDKMDWFLFIILFLFLVTANSMREILLSLFSMACFALLNFAGFVQDVAVEVAKIHIARAEEAEKQLQHLITRINKNRAVPKVFETEAKH